MIGKLVKLSAGQGDTDGNREALPERAGSDVNPGQNHRHRVTFQARAELTKGEELIVRDRAGGFEHRIQEWRRMAFGEDQVVVIGLARSIPVVPEMAGEQHRHQVCRRHRRGRVA